MPPPIKVYFLGTGGTTPFGLRKMPCVAVKYEQYLVQFDFGEYCQYSLLEFGLHPFRSKTYILLTHYHADHVGGLPPFLHTLNIAGGKERITIVGPEGLQDFIESVLNIFGIKEVMKRLRLVEVRFKEYWYERIIEEKKFELYAFQTYHNVPSLGYVFKEKDMRKFDEERARVLGIPRGPIRGRLLRGLPVRLGNKIIRPEDVTKVVSGRKIVYTGDTTTCSKFPEVFRNADLLIHEATYLKCKHGKLAEERFHATVEDACIVAKTSGVKRLALIHLSPRYSELLEEVREIAQSILGSSVELILPIDGDVITL